MQDLNPLSQAEKIYAQKLSDLFQLVTPQKPEKGIRALLLRARQRVATEGVSPEQALAEIYAGAKERTERRVRLLAACPLTPPPNLEPPQDLPM